MAKTEFGPHGENDEMFERIQIYLNEDARRKGYLSGKKSHPEETSTIPQEAHPTPIPFGRLAPPQRRDIDEIAQIPVLGRGGIIFMGESYGMSEGEIHQMLKHYHQDSLDEKIFYVFYKVAITAKNKIGEAGSKIKRRLSH